MTTYNEKTEDQFSRQIKPVLFNTAKDGSGTWYFPITDSKGRQITSLAVAKTAFGLMAVAELEPVTQLQFPYNINTLLTTSQENGGAVTQANAMAHLSTGSSANQSAQLLSRREIPYRPGMGGAFKGTAVFTTGVANSTQYLGIGDSFDGYFFGYSGATFGVLVRTKGEPEIQTLTITTASNTAEDITITLNGVAVTDVTVTAAGADSAATRTTTANDIAAHDYSGVGKGWTAKAVGPDVQFIAWDAGPKTGTFSLAANGEAVGSFAETENGVAAAETFTAQSSWNQDVMDGSGLSGMTLDPTKGNVYEIQYQWLGFGQIIFSIEDDSTGEIIPVHIVVYTNANTEPSIANPSLHLCGSVSNTSNTSDITMDIGSMAGFIEGKESFIGSTRGVSAHLGSVASTELPIITLRSNEVYQGKLNKVTARLNLVSASLEHSKPGTVRFLLNATLIAAAFTDLDANTSVMQKDTTATAVSGGVELLAIDLGKVDSELIDIETLDLELLPGETVTATAIVDSGTGAEFDAAFNFVELF